jgi:myo-inositol-1(or 4)-monophosphatase
MSVKGRRPRELIDESHALACRAVVEAGRLLVRLSRGPLDARLKDGYELVTRGDTESDKLVRRMIGRRFPDHRIVSEESSPEWSRDASDGPVWIIDPLDGTVNFAHRNPYCAVSVAFALNGTVMSGAVHAPFLRQSFDAVRDGGARLNGQPISVGAPSSLAEAIVSTGFPHDHARLERPIERVASLILACRDVRRTGAPSLDIAWVGAGMVDAHTEDLAPWDVAAAGLVATEAGARRGTIGPLPSWLDADLAGTGFVVAAPTIYDELVALLSHAT